MKLPFKPDAYNSVSPYLIVDGANGTIEFLKTVFDAIELRRYPGDNATSVQEPVKKDDEDKRGGVKDAGGTTWWIGTKVE